MKYLLGLAFLLSIPVFSMDDQSNKCPYLQPINKIIYENNETLLSSVLSYTENLNIKDSCDRTPLHVAIIHEKNDTITNSLLNKNIDLSAQDDMGRTVLHWALHKRKDKDFIHNLVDLGAPLDIKDNEGRTPLEVAFLTDNMQVADILMEKGASIDLPDTQGMPPLFRAIQDNDLNLVTRIIKFGKNLNYQDQFKRSALHFALLRAKNDQTVTSLLESAIDVDLPDADGKTPLHYMVIQRRGLPLFETLAKRNPKYDLKDSSSQTALDKAIINAYGIGISFLLPKMIKLNAIENKMALFMPAITHSLVEVIKLVGDQVDPNCTDDEGDTPLHYAVKQNKVHLIAPLLSKGAIKSLKNKAGKTASELALELKYQNIADVIKNN